MASDPPAARTSPLGFGRTRPPRRPALWQVLRARLKGASARMWALDAGILGLAGAIYLAMLKTVHISPLHRGGTLVVAALVTALFAAAEIWVVHLHIHRSYQSLSLNEIPLVLGLFMLPGPALVLSQVAGAAISLRLHRHQSPSKLLFNLANLSLAASIDILVFRTIAPLPDPASPRTWIAVFLSVTVGNSAAIAMIILAMSLSEGRLQTEKLGSLALASMVGTVLNGSLGLISVGLAMKAPQMTWLLAIPAGGAVLAFRVFGSERDRNEQMEFLYQSSQLLQRAFRTDSALVQVLVHGMSAFRVQVAELTLLPAEGVGEAVRTTVTADGTSLVSRFPPSEDTLLAIVAAASGPVLLRSPVSDPEVAADLEARGVQDVLAMPLRTDGGVIGTIVFGNRLGALFFSEGEARLFETYARHLSVSLETGRLALDLQHQAYHDSLTGLPNRAHLARRLGECLAGGHDGDRAPAVLILDLDDFKLVNDGLGHAAGDLLLRAVSERLLACVDPEDTVARLGGDEFAVLLRNTYGIGPAGAAAEHLAAALARPFVIEGNTITVRASIGIADSADCAATPDDLLRHADVAMYKAKAAGKANARRFESEMQHEFEQRHRLKSDLERGLAAGEFVLRYQPIVRLATGRLYGAEALLRWQHPDGLAIGPAEFIPIAEETGLIGQLGDIVVRTACEQAARWQRRHGPDAPMVTMNISGRQLQDPRFVARFAGTIRRLGVRPQGLVLEITESVMLDESIRRRDPLGELKALGVLLSVDDFGTGYSSLSQLSEMPIDVLKIAKPFVDKLDGTDAGSAFASAIIVLSKTLKLRVVAEGIETSQQLERLWDLHCDLGQGYYFGQAMPAERFERLAGGDVAVRATLAEAEGVPHWDAPGKLEA